MYQLIKSNPKEGITVKESLSLSSLREEMCKEVEEFFSKKKIIRAEQTLNSAYIDTDTAKYFWKINEVYTKVPVRGGYLTASEMADPDYPGIIIEFSADKRIVDGAGDKALVLVEQSDGVLRSVVYEKMYEEEPSYNRRFGYDSEMLKTLCYSSYLQENNKPGKLTYQYFCRTLFTDSAYIKKILSDEEFAMYEDFVQAKENGYL